MTTAEEAGQRQRLERARAIALFRYSLVQEVISPHLTPGQRGRRVRELAAAAHAGPDGQDVQVSYQSINRWKRAYLGGGFEALVPAPRQATPRTPGEVLELAAALKRENPERTAAQVQRILRASSGWAPSDRTLQRLFGRLELHRPPPGEGQQQVFGRFEAARPNELWTGDALHGPQIAGRKAYLFCFIDDHSRAVMGARWAFHEDVVRLAAALRPALASRGVPESVYVDNGSAFVDAWLLRACAVLGIKLVHSRPRPAAGQGKDRAVLPYCPRPVPGRDQRRARRPWAGRHSGRRPGGAEPAVQRLAPGQLPPHRAFGDQRGAAGPLGGEDPGPAAAAVPGAAA